MSKSPAFQFYPADFLADSNQATMEPAEVGIYIRLICRCWIEGHIPADPKKLAMMSGVTMDVLRGAWPAIAPCFVPDPAFAGYLIHPRLDRERAKQAAYREKRREAGRRGGVAASKRSTATVELGAPPLSSSTSVGSSASAVSSPSGVSLSSHSGEEAPPTPFERLVAYVGEQHRELVGAVSQMPGVGPAWAASVLALFGPGESLDRAVNRIPEDQRPTVLALALSRFAGDATDWSIPLFRSFFDRAYNDRDKAASQDADVARGAARFAGLKPVLEERRAARPNDTPPPDGEVDVDMDGMVNQLATKMARIPRA